jgi:hypothetical protein
LVGDMFSTNAFYRIAEVLAFHEIDSHIVNPTLVT